MKKDEARVCAVKFVLERLLTLVDEISLFLSEFSSEVSLVRFLKTRNDEKALCNLNGGLRVMM